MQRKLAAIYDAIDAQQFKTAVKLANKKDVAKSMLVLGLKAHALQRMGRTDEALQACREVQSSDRVDDGALGTVATVYKSLGMADEATACYEQASAVEPDNEEMAVTLFFCYLRRAKDASKQKTFAMGMYKKFKNPGYLTWAAVSMVQEAKAGGRGLPLAEKMMSKSLAEGSNGGQTTEMHVSVLAQQGRFEEAAAIMTDRRLKRAEATAVAGGGAEAKEGGGEGEGAVVAAAGAAAGGEAAKCDASTLLPTEETKLEAQMDRRAAGAARDMGTDGADGVDGAARARELTATAHELYRDIVTTLDPDEWEAYRSFVGSLFDMVDDGASPDADAGAGGRASEALSSSYAFLVRMQEREDATGSAGTTVEGRNPRAQRAPFLAEVCLLSRLIAWGATHRGDGAKEGAVRWVAQVARDAHARWSPPCDAAGLDAADAAAATSAALRVLSMTLAAVMEAYVDRFGHKQCCVGDLMPFLWPLVGAVSESGGGVGPEVSSKALVAAHLGGGDDGAAAAMAVEGAAVDARTHLREFLTTLEETYVSIEKNKR